LTNVDTPKNGTVDVPKNSTVTIQTLPEHGSVEVNDKGEWKFTPDPSYVGDDSFVIQIANPDGTTEDVIVDIDVDEVPLAENDNGSDANDPDNHDLVPEKTQDADNIDSSAPKTGDNMEAIYLFGDLALIFGIGIIPATRKLKQNKRIS
jgi:hypothetical protein